MKSENEVFIRRIFQNCQLSLLQMKAGLTKQTLLCFSRHSYCQKSTEFFLFLKLKVFQFLVVCLEIKGNANTGQERSRALLFNERGFSSLFFSFFIKAIPFGTKYSWTDS